MNIANNALPFEAIKEIFKKETTTFFLIKSNSDENIQTSQNHNVWATTPKNENKFIEAYKEKSPVILIFSVNGSSKFCGYALMMSEPGKSTHKDVCFYYNQKIFKGKNFDVQWLRVLDLPFQEVPNLTNRLNKNKCIKVGRDGQEIERFAGIKLCEHFESNLMKMKIQGVDVSQRNVINTMGGIIDNNNNNSNIQNNNRNNYPHNYRAVNTTTTTNNSGNGPMLIYHPSSQEMYMGETNLMLNNLNGYNDMINMNNNCINWRWRNLRDTYGISPYLLYNYYNPALRLYPIDLSNMKYDNYLSYYEKSMPTWQMRMSGNEIKF